MIFIVLLIIIILIYLYFTILPKEKKEIEWGTTFSYPYAEQLGLNWQETYLAILDDLKVDWLRIPVYWSDIEKNSGIFDFSRVDWQIREASNRGVNISLVIGQRVPRWPECWFPKWVEKLNKKEREDRVLKMLEKTVNHYKEQKVIKYWQVENEPLLSIFGKCPSPDKEFLQREVALVKEIDLTRPVVVTDSGELSSWFRIAKIADVLGVSMYRVVWNKYFGYFNWKWVAPPSFYRIKTYLIQNRVNKVINTELQLEPWSPNGDITLTPIKEQMKSMSLDIFRENIEFARKTQFSPTFVWGVEWWYWMKTVKNISDFWEEGGKLWQ